MDKCIGLTNFKGFSTDTLLSILSWENQLSSGVKLDLDGLHFLFEAKASKNVLNDLQEVDFVSETLELNPFDCYVLGYIAFHTSCKWTISVVAGPTCYKSERFARGTMEDGALCPAVAKTVNLTFINTLYGTSGLRQFLTALPSFLARTKHLNLVANSLGSDSCDLSQSLPSLPHLQSLYLSLNAIGSTVEPVPSLPSSCTTSSADSERGSTGHPLSSYRSDLEPLIECHWLYSGTNIQLSPPYNTRVLSSLSLVTAVN